MDIGRTLIFFGIILVILGALFSFGHRVPFFGRLPGDIIYEKENFRFYAPIATSIIISIILTIVFNVLFGTKN